MDPIFNLSLISGGNLWEKLLLWYQNSLLRELVDYVGNQLFAMEFGVYENFSVSGGTGTSIRNLILGICIGMMIAAFSAFYMREVQGKFIRTLLKRGCLSPASALTLRELGMFRSSSVRSELSRGGMLTKLTRCVSSATEASDALGTSDGDKAPLQASEEAAPECTPEHREALSTDSAAVGEAAPTRSVEKIDFTTARFYIPEDLKYRAEVRYRGEGFGALRLAAVIVIELLLAFLVIRFAPTLLNFADWLISVLGG